MANIIGTNAADVLTGTAVSDTISALAGSDRASGGAGNDTISGGEGGDTLSGGDDDDVIYGFGSSDAVAGSGDIRASLVSNAFNQPVFAASAPGDPNRMFVIELHSGQIRILNPATGAINAAAFLDIGALIAQGGEEGLLGLAFHPNYAANGQFYVYIVNLAGDIEVRRYLRSTGNPNLADPASGDVILTIPHPGQSNHNGGWMGFGPDGFLYISVGDGGGGGDAPNNAQNKNVLLGKMLRIDVNGDDFPTDADRDYHIPAGNPFVNLAGADEIWALGLRNGWRPSFDRQTGDLYIADVGQGEREEVNFQAAGSAGGANYGWKVKEGTLVYDDTIAGNPPATTPPLTDPLIDYPHVAGPGGGFSVTGGYVYRGTAAGLKGVYLFADFVSNQLWSFRVVNGAAVDFANRTAQLVVTGGSVDSIASFAEDGSGNLYVLGLDGEIFRLDPQVGAGDGADSITGGNGNDTIYGGAGNDTWLSGEAGGDRIYGGIGDDRIDGGADNDAWLGGDAGLDYITGGTGNDRIDGGADNDAWLGGDAGLDYITGGTGNDRIDGGADSDTWLGGDAGLDYITGGLGNDRIDGGADGDTWLGGDAGADYVTGALGNDRLDGGSEGDFLFGDAGNDYITAGTGDDLVEGGAGTDGLFGNAGLDTFDFNTGSNSDNIYGFEDNIDTIRIDPAYGFANAAAVVAATTASGLNARINLPGGFSIYLVDYLATNTIASLGDDIVIG